MLTGFEYALSAEPDLWCVRRLDAPWLLCGRQVWSVPKGQPLWPRRVHLDCLDVLYGRPPHSVDGCHASAGFVL